MDHNLTSLFALNVKLDRDDQTIPASDYDACLAVLHQTNITSENNTTPRSVYDRNALVKTSCNAGREGEDLGSL